MKFLLASWGSNGDLHPFLALGREMRRRGHEVMLVSTPIWKEQALAIGLDFVEAGPAMTLEDIIAHPEVFSTKNMGVTALRSLMEIGITPMLDEMYRVLCELAPSYDALIAHQVILTAGAVAEKTGIPWATVTMAPCSIPSSYTAPPSAMQPFHGALGRLANRAMWKVALMAARSIFDPPLNVIRERESLKPIRDSIFEGASKTLNLQFYSEQFSARPPDWSEEIQYTGFCHWDPEDYTAPAELTAFLKQGNKPWLFTLGSSAIAHPQGFFEIAAEAMRGIPERAILLVGDKRNIPPSVPDNVFVQEYAPYGWIMPRCSAVAHQCGMGTTAQTLRAGIPSVACPYGFDQPSNAMHLEAIHAGIYLPQRKRTPRGLVEAMREVTRSEIARRAAEIGEVIRMENGPARACQLLEKSFTAKLRPEDVAIYSFIDAVNGIF